MKPRLLPALAFLLLLAGCAGTKSRQAPPIEDPGPGWTQNVLEDTALFLATDDSLGKRLEIDNLASYTNKASSLKVMCRLANTTAEPLPIQLHVLFRRADGTTLEDLPWKTVTLPVGRAIPFETTDESGNAVRALIQVRAADTRR